jgi:hypothetical protein
LKLAVPEAWKPELANISAPKLSEDDSKEEWVKKLDKWREMQ